MFQRSVLALGITGTSVLGLLTTPALAAPSITISGLSGAEHWTWIEGENRTAGAGDVVGSTSSSGQRYWGKDAVAQGDFIQWDFTAPTNLSSSTKLYQRAALGNARNNPFSIDNVVVADRHMAMQSGSLPNSFLVTSNLDTSPGEVGIDIGALSEGAHTLKIQKTTTLTLSYWRFDGILLYDGTPVLPTTLEAIGSRNWLANPSSAASPELAGPVSADIDVTGLGANDAVHYRLNNQVYVPGTEIGPGSYELEVYVLTTVGDDVFRTAYSGANFTVIPEPASLALVAGGLLAGLSRPRRGDSN